MLEMFSFWSTHFKAAPMFSGFVLFLSRAAPAVVFMATRPSPAFAARPGLLFTASLFSIL